MVAFVVAAGCTVVAASSGSFQKDSDLLEQAMVVGMHPSWEVPSFAAATVADQRHSVVGLEELTEVVAGEGSSTILDFGGIAVLQAADELCFAEFEAAAHIQSVEGTSGDFGREEHWSIVVVGRLAEH